MGPGRLGTWNKVPAPSMNTEGMQKGNDKAEGWAGKARMSSVEMGAKSEQAGGMTSAQTSLKIKGAGTRKSSQAAPEVAGHVMSKDMGMK